MATGPTHGMDFGRDSGEFGQEKWRIWPTMIWYNGISWRCIMDSKIKILLSLDFYVVWRVILLNHTQATQSLIVDDHLPWTGNPILNPSIFEGMMLRIWKLLILEASLSPPYGSWGQQNVSGTAEMFLENPWEDFPWLLLVIFMRSPDFKSSLWSFRYFSNPTST